MVGLNCRISYFFVIIKLWRRHKCIAHKLGSVNCREFHTFLMLVITSYRVGITRPLFPVNKLHFCLNVAVAKQEHSDSADLRQTKIVGKMSISCNVEMHTVYLFIVRWTATSRVINSRKPMQVKAARGSAPSAVCNGTQWITLFTINLVVNEYNYKQTNITKLTLSSTYIINKMQ